jgi:hypothetical protein
MVVVLLAVFARPAAAFDTWWHAVETQQAADATGFSSDARLVLQIENYLTDMIGGVTAKVDAYPQTLGALYSSRFVDEGYNFVHFDGLWDIDQVTQNWDRLEKNSIAAIRKASQIQGPSDSFRKIAELTALAASMHAVQDFYSHSNWVNTLIQPGKEQVPIWFDIPRAERSKMSIHTGAYPDDSAKPHENHAQLNKDSSSRTLNGPAVDAATRASIDWIKRLMADDPSLPWDEMKSYSIKDDLVMKRYLYELDSTFTTTTSIALNHFDGPKPKKFVFAQGGDVDKEIIQAKTALGLTIAAYLPFVAAKGNEEYHLPSPYWSSHFIYHVPRDIADGLMCAGVVYKKP